MLLRNLTDDRYRVYLASADDALRLHNHYDDEPFENISPLATPVDVIPQLDGTITVHSPLQLRMLKEVLELMGARNPTGLDNNNGTI